MPFIFLNQMCVYRSMLGFLKNIYSMYVCVYNCMFLCLSTCACVVKKVYAKSSQCDRSIDTILNLQLFNEAYTSCQFEMRAKLVCSLPVVCCMGVVATEKRSTPSTCS